ncbi:pseudouridylate synthase I [Nitzschia inconspicua]|uniref:tRNA pseudouridine synthase n=1 Tax=Nitzschia inconspicua TaxID=303405 RepID=A0A9K3M6F2_9STRA|nr:pseudouridylate synthase I [Nitzschia inconspicua]
MKFSPTNEYLLSSLTLTMSVDDNDNDNSVGDSHTKELLLFHDDEDEEEVCDSIHQQSSSSSSSSSLEVIRYRCRVAYDGTGFCGFQLQGGRLPKKLLQENLEDTTTTTTEQQQQQQRRRRHRSSSSSLSSSLSNMIVAHSQRTVQGELEAVLQQRFQRLVKVIGAGRTDAGVHARGQAIHFDLYRNETTTTKSTTTTTRTKYKKKNNNNTSTSLVSSLSLQHTMNRMLPSDVVVWNLQQVSAPPLLLINSTTATTAISKDDDDDDENDDDDDPSSSSSSYPNCRYQYWNAMQSSTYKLYSYRIHLGCGPHGDGGDAIMDPILRRTVWQYEWGYDVTIKELDRVLQRFVGTHDFVCFAGALEANQRKTGRTKTTIRTIYSIDLIPERGGGTGGGLIDESGFGNDDSDDSDYYYYSRIDIRLNGALYKMVRNLVGTALDVCRGRISETYLNDMLHQPQALGLTRRDNPSKPAPPHGLTLERVYYSNYEQKDDDDDDDASF